MQCPRCRAELTDGALFCPVCSCPFGREADGGDPLLGKTVAGRYRVERLIAQGGMGRIYEAEQLALRRPIALKVLMHEVAARRDAVTRFRAEAELAARLDHPNMVRVLDFGDTEDGTPYLAMELVEGSSLRSVLRRAGTLPAARVMGLGAQLASALAHAHTLGVIHRDLKPDNVLVTEEPGGKDHARVLDFGIATVRESMIGSGTPTLAVTLPGFCYGTPHYMAPEQITGQRSDGRIDVYALGAALYELLVGRPPFEGQKMNDVLEAHLSAPVVPPSLRRPELGIPREVDRVVVWCLEKDPRARPTMAELRDELTRIRAALTTQAAPDTEQMPKPAPSPAQGRTTSWRPEPTTGAATDEARKLAEGSAAQDPGRPAPVALTPGQMVRPAPAASTSPEPAPRERPRSSPGLDRPVTTGEFQANVRSRTPFVVLGVVAGLALLGAVGFLLSGPSGEPQAPARAAAEAPPPPPAPPEESPPAPVAAEAPEKSPEPPKAPAAAQSAGKAPLAKAAVGSEAAPPPRREVEVKKAFPLFEDRGFRYARAGTSNGLRLGSEVLLVGGPLAGSRRRALHGKAKVVEVWRNLARLEPEPGAAVPAGSFVAIP